MPTKVLKGEEAVIDPIVDFEKFRAKRKKYHEEQLDNYADMFGPSEDNNGVMYKGNKGLVKLLTAPIHEEDKKGLGNFLADVDAYRAKYRELGRHLEQASANSELDNESENGLQEFLNEIAKTAEHREWIDKSPQDLYGKLIQIGAKNKLSEENIGELWYDAQKNNPDGKKARALLVKLMIGDLVSNLTQASLHYNTRHLEDADLDRLDSYKVVLGQLGRMASGGQYAPNFDKMRSLNDLKGELDNILGQYLDNPDAPHHKNPKSAVYHREMPKILKGNKVKVGDIRDAANDNYELRHAA
ncbi:hypothetical protein HYU09_00975 [Candidatus Woesearchaeota archaeon]|nr:hypothetical protein [Candidatus Woesearchaeota archaeon]